MWNLLFDRPQVTLAKKLPKRAGRRPFVECLEDRCLPGTLIDLGTLGGYNSYGLAINSSGVVIGASYSYMFTGDHAYSYASDNGTMTDIGTLGGTFSAAFGINDEGQIVGASFTSDGTMHAFC